MYQKHPLLVLVLTALWFLSANVSVFAAYVVMPDMETVLDSDNAYDYRLDDSSGPEKADKLNKTHNAQAHVAQTQDGSCCLFSGQENTQMSCTSDCLSHCAPACSQQLMLLPVSSFLHEVFVAGLTKPTTTIFFHSPSDPPETPPPSTTF